MTSDHTTGASFVSRAPVTPGSAATLVRAVLVLDRIPSRWVLEEMVFALMNGPPDLAAQLHLAGSTAAESLVARRRLMAIVQEAGGSPLAVLELIDEFCHQARLRRRFRRIS